MCLVFYFIHFIGAFPSWTFPGGKSSTSKNKPIRAEFLEYQTEWVTETDSEALEEFKKNILRHKIIPPVIPPFYQQEPRRHLQQ